MNRFRNILGGGLAASLLVGCGEAGAVDDREGRQPAAEEIRQPAEVIRLLLDPHRAEEGALALLAGLGIGVYTPDGTRVQAGSETGEDDFWLYDFQIPMLAALADGPNQPFSALVELVRNAGVEVEPAALTETIRRTHVRHADAFLVETLAVAGPEVSEDAELTPLQAWLLALDILVRPNRTANDPRAVGAPVGEGTARLPGAAFARWMPAPRPLFASTPGRCTDTVTGPALSGWGFVHGAAGYGEVIAAEQAFRSVNGALFASQLRVELEGEPDTVHEGHEGPGNLLTLTVTVVSHFQPIPVPVTCGWLTAIPLPGITGPIEGATVSWEVPSLLRQRGTLTLDGGHFGGQPGRTDQMGRARLEFTAQEEAAGGLGVVYSEIGLVTAVVDPRDALISRGVDPMFAMLLPPVRPAVEVITLEWHETDGWRVEAEVITVGDMTTKGEWNGIFHLAEGDQIEGKGTVVTTVTGSCVRGVSQGPLVIGGERVDDMLHVRLTGDPDFADTEPDVEVEETMACAVRTLVELPAFFNGMADLVNRMMTAERACPLEVPLDAEAATVECGGVTFQVTRTGLR